MHVGLLRTTSVHATLCPVFRPGMTGDSATEVLAEREGVVVTGAKILLRVEMTSLQGHSPLVPCRYPSPIMVVTSTGATTGHAMAGRDA